MFRGLCGILLTALMAAGCVEYRDPPKGSSAKQGDVVKYDSGLQYTELKIGEGAEAKPGDLVEVHYTGKLTKEGTEFDSSVGGDPFVFRLGAGKVIKGWDIGVAGMKVGGKRELTIPAALGYGAKGGGDKIPPNADLTFEVELVNIRK